MGCELGFKSPGRAAFLHAPWARKRCSKIVTDSACRPQGIVISPELPVTLLNDAPFFPGLLGKFVNTEAQFDFCIVTEIFITEDDILAAVKKPSCGQQELVPWFPWQVVELC